MRRKDQITLLLVGLFWFYCLSEKLSAQERQTKISEQFFQIQKQRDQLAAGDWFEWVTLIFGSFLPPADPLTHLRQAIEGRTTLILHPFQRFVFFETERLSQYSFLHAEMCSQAMDMDLKKKLRWRDYFNNGGTLFLDACNEGSAENNGTITESWKTWGESVFGDSGWSPLNRGHELSYSFYLLDKRMLLGKRGTPISLLKQGGRVIIIHNNSQRLSWTRLKRSEVSASLNPPEVEIHLRLYINFLMLLLTGDYKGDQLHLPTILLRRR